MTNAIGPGRGDGRGAFRSRGPQIYSSDYLLLPSRLEVQAWFITEIERYRAMWPAVQDIAQLFFFFVGPVAVGILAYLGVRIKELPLHWRIVILIASVVMGANWLGLQPEPHNRNPLFYGALNVVWGAIITLGFHLDATRVGWRNAVLVFGTGLVIGTLLFFTRFEIGLVLIYFLTAVLSAISRCPASAAIGASLSVMYGLFLVPSVGQGVLAIIFLWPLALLLFPIAFGVAWLNERLG